MISQTIQTTHLSFTLDEFREALRIPSDTQIKKVELTISSDNEYPYNHTWVEIELTKVITNSKDSS